jgi:pyruvate dehydrogenase E1 component alpha subunit
MTLSIKEKKKLLETMIRIRLFEEKVDQLIKAGKIHGTTHLYIGEEAVATGACAAIRRDDYITSTHRGHGHCVAKGGDLNRMLSELLGKKNGYCHGRGGSMHIASFLDGILGANGIVGGSLGIATGAAFSVKKQKLDKIVICFFGDGATNQGVFYESLNIARMWNLPIIYLCENNMYAISMNIQKATGTAKLSRRVKGFDVRVKTIDGNNIEKVYYSVLEFADGCRSGDGPFFLECQTYRVQGHSRSDNQPYRTKDEVRKWKQKDPIALYKKKLIKENALEEEDYYRFVKKIEKELMRALEFAENDDFPSASDLYSGLYYELDKVE